jgi:glycosyltransferase involved in cell wall biosynthesis
VQKPSISIVTVCRNAAMVLDKTIQSVLNQTDKDFEYLIIDGLSTDSTARIVAKYSDRVAVFLSERDNGIYDAMNKGVALASGEFVLFMNAGDVFENPNVLGRIRQTLGTAHVVYGDVVVDFGQGILFHKQSKPIDKLYRGMICSHQSLLVARQLLLDHPFSLSFKIAADYHQLLACAKAGAVFQRINYAIARVSAGGVSDVKQVETYMEYIRAVREVNPEQKQDVWCLELGLLQISFRTLIKKILPSSAHSYVRRLKALFNSSSSV